MKPISVCFITLAILMITAHRLPAPIQEIPETPSPTPAVPPPAAPTAPPVLPPPAPVMAPTAEPRKPLPKQKSKPSEAPRSAEPQHTMPAPKARNETPSTDGTMIPKGAVHLVIHDDSDARKIFNYFQFPGVHAPVGTTGLYRIEVSPDGTVAAVTILKSMGSAQDVTFMKAFVQWRAAPGPLRIVDVPRRIFEFHRAISR